MTTAWPAGVTVRFLTVGGATVDLTKDGRAATCLGCNRRQDSPYSLQVHEWAQAHATTCRALPRPETSKEGQ